MTIFRVGQRVRIVRFVHDSEMYGDPAPEALGCAATIICRAESWTMADWELLVDGLGEQIIWALSAELAPLTDPQADAFMESIKKMVPNNVVTKKPA